MCREAMKHMQQSLGKVSSSNARGGREDLEAGRKQSSRRASLNNVRMIMNEETYLRILHLLQQPNGGSLERQRIPTSMAVKPQWEYPLQRPRG